MQAFMMEYYVQLKNIPTEIIQDEGTVIFFIFNTASTTKSNMS